MIDLPKISLQKELPGVLKSTGVSTGTVNTLSGLYAAGSLVSKVFAVGKSIASGNPKNLFDQSNAYVPSKWGERSRHSADSDG